MQKRSERDMMNTVRLQTSYFPGITGRLADNLTRNWLIGLYESNPGILAMFRERDLLPYRLMLGWLGEFAGKYITGAYYIYRLTLDHELYTYIQGFLEELLSCQAEDGYLGPFSKQCRLTGSFSQKPDEVEGTWDAWGHYHIMYGLLLWYEETQEEQYLQCVEKIAGLFLRKYYNPAAGSKSLLSMKSPEANLSPIHAFAMLCRLTEDRRYLDFALEIEKDLSHEGAGDYIGCALDKVEFYQCPQPRWESLHVIMGLAELYRITGKHYYLQTVEQVFFSILKTDVHNTGAFSTEEQAVGSPFHSGHIETCCVIAYDALAVELFKLTGNPEILDFLELSHYNACMGAWSPTGRWSTYHTPMAGERHSSVHDITFHCRAGSPELNCCSVNAPRGIGMFSEWAVTQTSSTLCINAYEDMDVITEDGTRIQINGEYPSYGKIQITIKHYTGQLALRIPGWSTNTFLTLEGEKKQLLPGSYFRLDCPGRLSMELHLDLTTHYLQGQEEFQGLVSIYRGPILFGTDVSLAGGCDLLALPPLNRSDLEAAPSVSLEGKIHIPLPCGITLGDFYHLGITGSQYTTWLEVN